MRIPQDIANLLAVSVRDLLWFKANVIRFLEQCEVPKGIIVDVKRKRKEPTIKLVQHVLDRLAGQGDEGFQIVRKMLTGIYYWNDLHSVPPDRKDQAVRSLKEFQEGFRRYQEQSEYKKAQNQQEHKMHEERLSRGRTTKLDHEKLQGFRDEFDETSRIENRQERGNRFQDLMNRIFDYYCDESKGAFRRIGEQIDGLFKFDMHWHYVEVRWRDEKANAADVSVLRDRAKGAYGGDTKALFISFNGFTKECLERLAGMSDERVVLMDGFDLRCVLDCQIAFDVLLAEKQAELVQNKRPFVSASEIISRRE